MKTRPMSLAEQEIVKTVPCRICGAGYNTPCQYAWPRRLFGGRPTTCRVRLADYITVALQRLSTKKDRR